MKIRWISFLLILICLLVGVYFLRDEQETLRYQQEGASSKKPTSDLAVQDNTSTLDNFKKDISKTSSESTKDLKSDEEVAKDIKSKQDQTEERIDSKVKTSEPFVNKSFKPKLTDDWLIEMQKRYDQERTDAIEVAQSRGMPIDGPNLFLRGVQDGRLLYYHTENVNAAISTGANLVRNTAPYNVNGSGITMGVWDAGSVRKTHQEFDTRVTVKDGASAHYHSTHVGGTIGGNGTLPAALGMAPSVLIDSYDWNSDITEMGSRGARYPLDANRIQISNHSYGVISGWINDDGSISGHAGWIWWNNITTMADSFFGQYDTEAADNDEVALNDPYYLIVKSAGNDRSDGPSNGNTVYYWNGSWTSVTYNSSIHPKGDGVYKSGYDTIPTSGNAKNILTIGAVNDAVTSGNRDITKAAMSTFSGWGPSDDGRIKPDVVGNGIQLTSADSASNSSYAILSGTSMAGPNVAGSAVLLQDYFDNKFPGHALRSSSLKGLIIATADDLGTAGPDYSYGWGLVNIAKAIDLVSDYATNPGNKLIVEGRLISVTNIVDQYVYESDGLTPFIATITWTDPKGVSTSSNDSTTPVLVNNLNLKVTAPDGTTTFLPYVLNRASPANVATTGVNNVDNTEQVRIASPVAGLYTVQIDFSGSLTGSSQYYSLIMQGVKKNVTVGLPLPISYTLGATAGSLQEIFINGSNFLLGANVTLLKTGSSNVVLTNKQVTPEVIKAYIPINTVLALDWEIQVTNPDGKIGSSLNKIVSRIGNLSSNTILTGSTITLTGTSSTMSETITAVKIIVDGTTEFQAVNTGTDFSTWSYTWNLVTEAGTISHNVKSIAYTTNLQELTPVLLTNITIDNIAPAVIINSDTNITTELGGSAIVSMKLQKKPTSDVVISFASDNTNEGTLSKNSLTFTTLNWFTPQTFNVIGVNELIDDDNKNYSVVVNPLVSSDNAYNNMNPNDLTFTNQDNDTASVIITGSNLVVAEILTSAQFQIRLATEPTSNVTVTITSSDTSEGTVSVASVLFTPLNWMTDVPVSVTGVDDLLSDGDVNFSITFPSITSSDTKYSAISIPAINAKCLDNENIGLNISTSSPFTYEGATSAILTFSLMSQPTANVTYLVTSNGTSQVSLSASTLTFTNANWNQPKNITVTAVNDNFAESDFNLSLNFGPASSADLLYNNNFKNFALTIKDNDVVGVLVSAISGNINENGTTAFFNMSLKSQPNQDVIISLISSNTAEATLSVSTYTFNSSNWNTLKKVIVIPIDDINLDGNISFTVIGTISTSDTSYQSVIFPNVNVLSVDDDIPSILVTANGSTVTESGGSTTASIQLKLAPTSDVSIPISSSDTTEGTVSPSTIVFTTLNWATPKTITITGVNDSIEDGSVNFNLITGVATSADGNYNGLSGAIKVFTNVDDDDLTPPVTVLNGSAEMSMRLGGVFADPLASSVDAKEGFISNINVSGSINNSLVGDYILSYNSSDSKGNMSNTVTRKISVVNSAGLNVSIKDFLIQENGGFDSMSISLKDAPNSNVVVDISVEGSGVTVVPNSLTFTNGNWNQNQTITISSINDSKVSTMTGKIKIDVNKPLSEVNYNIVTTISLSYTLIEDDVNGFDISTKNILLSENGGKGEVSVSLRAEPSSDVLINILNPSVDRFIIEPSQLRFTKLNWNTNQKFKITSIDNNSPSANQVFNSNISIGIGSDSAFLLLDASQLTKALDFTQTNEDVANMVISNKKLLVGPSLNDSFTVKLTAQPKDKVFISVGNKNDLEISASIIEFDATTWSTEQEITVSGTSSSNISANLEIAIAPSSDLDFLSIAKQIVIVNVIALEEDLIELDAETNEGGQISPAGKFVVLKNELVNFVTTPLADYEIEKIIIDGAEVSKNKQFSITALKNIFVKVFFIRKVLVPTPEPQKSLPSSEQLTELETVKVNSALDTGVEANLDIALDLSKLKLTDIQKLELLESLNNLTDNSISIKDLDLPILTLMNLKESSSSNENNSIIISIVQNILKNPTLSDEQSTQLLKVIDAVLDNSSAEFLSLNNDALKAILEKIIQIELKGLKSSGQEKAEVLLDKIKIVLEKIDFTSLKGQALGEDTGASEINLPQSLISKLKAMGNSIVFFNETFKPYNSSTYLDLSVVPVGDITTIELLDANFNKIDINNLTDAIIIKIPISQALVDSLKANETIRPMYFNTVTNKWSTLGITFLEQTSEFIIFKVNHLTDFALFKIASTEDPVTDTPLTDTPIVTNPSPSTNTGGGGGGCRYIPQSTVDLSGLFFVLVFIGFYLYRKKEKK